MLDIVLYFIDGNVTDHLGTPLALTDEQGKLLWEASPDDWAAVSNEQGKTGQPIRYQGQYEDEESGLYYNRHRYYDPQLGRYVNQDPIGLLGGVNVFSYPLNPLSRTDPLGLVAPLVAGAALILGGIGLYSAVRGSVKGSAETLEGGRIVRSGRNAEADALECLSLQARHGYSACPRSGADLQRQYEEGRDQVREGLGKIQSGVGTLATSVPGTSITGPLPTSGADLAVGGAATILINTGGSD